MIYLSLMRVYVDAEIIWPNENHMSYLEKAQSCRKKSFLSLSCYPRNREIFVSVNLFLPLKRVWFSSEEVCVFGL